ncbi:MAG: DUF58 domain-containing protein [Ferruginibacter sp.]
MISFFIPSLFLVAKIVFSTLMALAIADYFFIFFLGRSAVARRITPDRFSNGDESIVLINVRNRMSFSLKVFIIDELPVQFQIRDFKIEGNLKPLESKMFKYTLRPVERGEYYFGNIIIFISSGLGLINRRQIFDQNKMISVYPSFLNFRKYQLMAEASSSNYGSRRQRRIGNSLEFEQIRDYVNGDDVRNLNWKATARHGHLLLNSYIEEKSQQVYCIIDKGRLMKMPFKKMSLLDYAINSTLVLSNICLRKQDKTGLITFSDKSVEIILSDNKPVQLNKIMHSLYSLDTDFLESNFEMLYLQLRQKVQQRSIIVLFTNFESPNSLKMQLPYIRLIAKYHLLVVVFFENTDLVKLSQADAKTVDDIYLRTIAEKSVYEKRMIIKELQQYGIMAILTQPENLTVQVINKYLDLKSRQAV